VTFNNYDMTTSFGFAQPPVQSAAQEEFRRMSMVASKENQTLMAQQGVIISSLVKGRDKANTARASLPDILHGPKAIASKREFMTVAPRYTHCELTGHLRTTQVRNKAPAAAKKIAELFARQEAKLLSEIRSGAYTGPGSTQSTNAGGLDNAADLQGGENYCKELLCRFYDNSDNTFDTVERTENTARQRDFCTRARLDLLMANDSAVQDCYDEVDKIAALYHTHNIPFTYADEWDLILLRSRNYPPHPLHHGRHRRPDDDVISTFSIDPELPMSDARNLGSGDPPHELALMTAEEGLKRPTSPP
jgi:hypothetical protein